jgi:muramoyltetrapeptide carboxypeptidase
VLAAASPKVLVGFSDVTALHQALAARLGAVTVHGPGVAGLGDGVPEVEAACRTLLLEAGPVLLQGTPSPRGGTADGVLVGGNLTVLAAGAGTDLVHPAAGGIVLLEDVDEDPYRLDRCLTQLLRSGWLDAARGVALGAFTRCGDPAEVRAMLEDRLGPLGVPVVHDLPFGHEPVNLPVPLGVRATLDAAAGTLSVPVTLR